MIIGTLPVVIAVSANLRNARRDGRLPWKRLAPSLALIALGIACVNRVELQALRQDPDADLGRYALGALLALAAVACWTVSAAQRRLAARPSRPQPAHLGHRPGHAAGPGRLRAAVDRHGGDRRRLSHAAGSAPRSVRR